MYTVIVRDRPVPQGSKIAVVSRTTKRAFVKDDNEKGLKGWRRNVAGAVRLARDVTPVIAPLDGPVVLAITFTVPRPLSTPKRKPAWPWRKPDLDKLLRSTFDALKEGGAYTDDARVVELLRAAKFYPQLGALAPAVTGDAKYMLGLAGTALDVLDTPGAVIRIAHLTELPGILAQLERAGFEAKDIAGGR
jgi:crossover junction endodeoxyribonuclease RusA